MTLLEAIESRHSVRHYIHRQLSEDMISALQAKIEECNSSGRLNIQLVTNETRAFTGLLSYGQFSGVENYFVMVGEKSADLDERVGYYGEQLVLLSQQLGLNTCWVGLSYHNVGGVYSVGKGEKLACMISLGYGKTQGHGHKTRKEKDVSNISGDTPSWFSCGVKAALLAPSSVNQQKYHFDYIQPRGNERPKVRADKGFSLFGYTQMDLGIAKCHFEIGAGKENFDWE